jgi:hypothetical protein
VNMYWAVVAVVAVGAAAAPARGQNQLPAPVGPVVEVKIDLPRVKSVKKPFGQSPREVAQWCDDQAEAVKTSLAEFFPYWAWAAGRGGVPAVVLTVEITASAERNVAIEGVVRVSGLTPGGRPPPLWKGVLVPILEADKPADHDLLGVIADGIRKQFSENEDMIGRLSGIPVATGLHFIPGNVKLGVLPIKHANLPLRAQVGLLFEVQVRTVSGGNKIVSATSDGCHDAPVPPAAGYLRLQLSDQPQIARGVDQVFWVLICPEVKKAINPAPRP